MEIRRIAGALGAEILGVDLSAPLSAETVDAIRQAYLEHLVIFFRDQTLDAPAYLRFAHLMGTPVEYPFVKGIDGYPEIIEVLKLEHERTNFGGVWHSDTAYLDEPPKGSMLLARQIPPYGGDTLFANQYLAYESLSDGMKRMLDPLVAVNSSAKADVSRTREDRLRDSARDDARAVYEVEHPVVRTHPETGRKALYVNLGHTTRFDGWTEAESKPLLDFLFAHITKPEFTCRFRWRSGSLAFWDNRCTMHFAINDYPAETRVMHRATICGDTPK